MSSDDRTHFGEFLTLQQSGFENNLTEQLKRVEKVTNKESRSSQHSLLLKLAGYSHNRQCRDNKLDTMTRLFASPNIKTKQKPKKWKRDDEKSGKSREKLKQQNSQEKSRESRRVSSESFSSNNSSTISPKQEFVKFRDSEDFIPRRNRAFSVDHQCSPIINKKRRQSAPEVKITLAKLPSPEPENDKRQSLEEKYSDRDRLSPSYSPTTELFIDNHPKEDHPSRIKKRTTRKISEASSTTSSVGTKSSRHKSRSITSSFHKLSSRQTFKREKQTLVDSKADKEELIPMKDDRFLNLLLALKDVTIIQPSRETKQSSKNDSKLENLSSGMVRLKRMNCDKFKSYPRHDNTYLGNDSDSKVTSYSNSLVSNAAKSSSH